MKKIIKIALVTFFVTIIGYNIPVGGIKIIDKFI